jgi:hypothetical protein
LPTCPGKAGQAITTEANDLALHNGFARLYPGKRTGQAAVIGISRINLPSDETTPYTNDILEGSRGLAPLQGFGDRVPILNALDIFIQFTITRILILMYRISPPPAGKVFE